MPLCLLLTLSALSAAPETVTTATATVTPSIPIVGLTFVEPEPEEPTETATAADEFERLPVVAEPGAPRILSTVEPKPPPAPPSKITATQSPKRRKLGPEEEVWYGWQNLLVSIPGLAIALMGIAAESSIVAYAGASIYAIGPTAVHWAHGNFDYGFAALGMQIGAPAIITVGALYVGLIANSGGGGDADVGSLALTGAILGSLVAIGVDAGAFAWVTEEELEIVPSVILSPQSSSFGIAGTF